MQFTEISIISQQIVNFSRAKIKSVIITNKKLSVKGNKYSGMIKQLTTCLEQRSKSSFAATFTPLPTEELSTWVTCAFYTFGKALGYIQTSDSTPWTLFYNATSRLFTLRFISKPLALCCWPKFRTDVNS